MATTRIGAAVALALLGAVSTAQAAWPDDKPITIVAPYAAGGNADIQARLVAQALSQALHQTVLVENRPGAGGMLGAQYVARSPADGYTLMMGAAAHVLGEFFYRNKLLDLRKDLAAVTQVSAIPNYIVVRPEAPYTTLKELLDTARAKPESVSCATPGVGTVAHLACALINQRYGTAIPTVPYRGGAPAITDVIGGQVTFYAGNEGLTFMRDQRLRGLAITSLERSPFAPELPAVAELIPGYDVSSWYGLFAPAGTPQTILARVSEIVAHTLAEPSARAQLDALGASAIGSNPEEFTAFIEAEFARWGPVAQHLSIALD